MRGSQLWGATIRKCVFLQTSVFSEEFTEPHFLLMSPKSSAVDAVISGSVLGRFDFFHSGTMSAVIYLFAYLFIYLFKMLRQGFM